MEQRYALIAPDFVVGPQTDPLRNLPVLACLLRQDLLDLEGLVRGLQKRHTCKFNTRAQTQNSTASRVMWQHLDICASPSGHCLRLPHSSPRRLHTILLTRRVFFQVKKRRNKQLTRLTKKSKAAYFDFGFALPNKNSENIKPVAGRVRAEGREPM